MNNQLIEKVIKYSSKSCPELVYSNPLIDKTVAREVSKSFVKILSVSKQNTNVGTNIRHCVLENIRKLCGNKSEGHVPITAEITGVLTAYYKVQVQSSLISHSTLEQRLDEFLARQLREDPLCSTVLEPEVIKALGNLDSNEPIVKTVINWNSNDKKTQKLLLECWFRDALDLEALDDLSLKLKEQIEQWILNSMLSVLGGFNNLELSLECKEMQNLITKCSLSPMCFQICSRILNTVLIKTTFNEKVVDFIHHFTKSVKLMMDYQNYSLFYPGSINYLVSFMDVDLDSMSKELKQNHVNTVMKHLKCLEYVDVVLLLSHFPQWFSEYFVNQCRNEANPEYMDMT